MGPTDAKADSCLSPRGNEEVTSQDKEWEQTHRKVIAQLVTLINQIAQVTKSFGGSTVICFHPQKDMFVIEKVEKKMLPDDLYDLWPKDNGDPSKPQEKFESSSIGFLLPLNFPMKSLSSDY